MAFDLATLDTPFAALEAFDWGGDAAPFKAIDDAVIAAHGDAALRGDLERRLTEVLGPGTSRAAREYACRKLSMIATAASVPAIAALLPDENESHMARFALERIGAPEAADAIRKALGTVPANLKIGMISSLAARGDAACVSMLVPLLAAEASVAKAAAGALGTIHTSEAVQALAAAKPAADVEPAVIDARLACAEALLRQGRPAEALAIYKSIAAAAAGQPAGRLAELAATRGILSCLESTAASR
jgi:HEAT repeat protein